MCVCVCEREREREREREEILVDMKVLATEFPLNMELRDELKETRECNDKKPTSAILEVNHSFTISV